LIRAFSTILSSSVQSAEHTAPALKMTQESIVLVQNDGTLPLAGNTYMVFGGFKASCSELVSALSSNIAAMIISLINMKSFC
jgi:beta-glucosidase-like glycosyl hydrolase